MIRDHPGDEHLTMAAVATLGWRTLDEVRDPWRSDQGSDDVLLLARLRAGDDLALGAVYDRHVEMVHGIARRVTGDVQIANDVTQDVFITLWQAPERVDLERGSIRSYLGVVAHRRAVDAVRKSVRRSKAESSTPPPPLEELFDEQLADADAVARCRERLLAILDDLPPAQRDAVMLAYFERRTFKEIARLLDIPEGTAKSRVRLALAHVRAVAGDELKGSM